MNTAECSSCPDVKMRLCLIPEAAGPSAGRSHFAPARLQRDVLRRRPLLDVPHPDPAVSGGRADVPGLAAGLHPGGRGRSAGLHG